MIKMEFGGWGESIKLKWLVVVVWLDSIMAGFSPSSGGVGSEELATGCEKGAIFFSESISNT